MKESHKQFYIAKLKEHRKQAITSFDQVTKQVIMLEGVIVFLDQAIKEAEVDK